MPRQEHSPEEIVAKLRQVDVLVSQGQSVAEAVRSIGVTQFTHDRWRKEFGGLRSDQVKRLKEVEKARAGGSPSVREPLARERLRKAVSDLALERLILREAARETLEPRPPPPLHRPCPAEVPCLGAPGLPGARPASLHTAESATRAGR